MAGNLVVESGGELYTPTPQHYYKPLFFRLKELLRNLKGWYFPSNPLFFSFPPFGNQTLKTSTFRSNSTYRGNKKVTAYPQKGIASENS